MSVKLLSTSRADLVNFMGGDDSVAMSAWVSFGNDDAERLEDRVRVRGLIDFLYRNEHMTPFESSVFTFRIETPIFVAREFMRHRSASYNEWSGRYSQMIPKFYIPTRDRPLRQAGKPGDYYFVPGSPDQYWTVLQTQKRVFQQAWDAYEEVLEAGVAKEVARNVLPLATYTQFYVTMNARNLMHFLNLRTAPNALQEIRDLAGAMEEHLKDKMPFTYESYTRKRGAE